MLQAMLLYRLFSLSNPQCLFLGSLDLQQGGGTVELEPCLNRTPQVSPTLVPAASERTVTTRAASSVNISLLTADIFRNFSIVLKKSFLYSFLGIEHLA